MPDLLQPHVYMPPKVIVLVLSYNGIDLLDDCLSSYLANDYPNFEVTVIDNGSHDGTKDWVERSYPAVTILRTEKNLNYSGGFNFGLRYAFGEKKADYVLVTNNDVKADHLALRELVRAAEGDALAGFVTGKVYYFDRPDVLQTVGKKEDAVRWNGDHIGGYERDAGQFDRVSERAFADDIFTLVRRSVYEAVGGYDENFAFQAEEFDWQARAKKAGFKILYTPGAKIWHKVSMTIGRDSAFKSYYDARNPMLVILLHKPPAFFRRYFWRHALVDVLLGSLTNIRRLRPAVSLALWRGMFSGVAWGIAHRKLTLRHVIGFQAPGD